MSELFTVEERMSRGRVEATGRVRRATLLVGAALVALAGCTAEIGVGIDTGDGGVGTTVDAGGAGSGGATGTGGGGNTTNNGTGGTTTTTPTITCTSGTMWTRGNHGSADMNPGQACISCHASMGEGPRLTIAGTVYPSLNEPDNCNGADGVNGAQIVITQANGKVMTLLPGTSGNFSSESGVAMPYTAKVVYMGRERAMITAQTTGDCNSCHTVTGANNAPGRIMLP